MERGRGKLGALLAAALAAAGLTACVPIAPPAPRAGPPQIFPSDTLTVADGAQLTGKRMNLDLPPDCVAQKSACDEINLINQLDGFDIDPTIVIGFASAIAVGQVTDSTIFVQPTAGGAPIGLNRLVWDPAHNVLAGHPKQQLAPGTEYKVVVTPSVNGQEGMSTFTTMSARKGLEQMVAQLESGAAYTAAGVSDRKLHIDTDSSGAAATYVSTSVLPGAGLMRTNDLGSGQTANEQVFDTTVPSTANAGTYTFGSFDSPQWLDLTTRTINDTPTGGAGPAAVRTETIGFVLVTPNPAACPAPAGGWPVAIFGPGVTRSKYDVLLASDENLKAPNCMATIAIDPVGHAYGPNSFVTIQKAPAPVTVTSHGRGVDVNGDGTIGNREGVQTKGQPDPNASIGLRDGLRQTALDNMALVRALEAGDGAGGGFAAGSGTLSTTDIKYYAQSLGGIYGTMVMATDPDLSVGALDVPGGPILEIARLSPGFRGEVGVELHNRVPSAYDCGGQAPTPANCTGFDEQTPLYLDPPVTNPSASAVAIQQIGGRSNWIERSGSPETFAAALLPQGKKVMYQFAYGDRTVPNPTNATIMRAGGLQGVTSVYRHDKDAVDQTCDPHGFLLDPRISPAARTQAQEQIAAFFVANGNAAPIDPDNAGPIWEVPVTNPSSLETVNFPNPPPTPSSACTGST